MGLVLILLVIWLIQPTGLDFKVYRDGGYTLLNDQAGLYAQLRSPDTAATGLPFTYPPFAAILFVPMAWFPFDLAVWIMFGLTVAALYAVAAAFAKRAPTPPLRWQAAHRWLTTPSVLTAVLLLTGSFSLTLWFGQINILLLAACYVAVARWGIGWVLAVVIGICGGIKLTPLALGLVFVLRKDVRSILVLGASFASTILLGAVIAPTASAAYWLDVLWDSSRMGGLSFFSNFSIRGLTEDAGLPSVLWLALVLASIAAVCVLLWRYRLAGALEPVDEVSLAALAMLLISPVTWSHHWVWWPMIGLAFYKISRHLGARVATGIHVALAIAVVPCLLWLRGFFMALGYSPDRGELPAWAPILTHGTVLAFLAILGVAVTATLLPRRAPAEPRAGHETKQPEASEA